MAGTRPTQNNKNTHLQRERERESQGEELRDSFLAHSAWNRTMHHSAGEDIGANDISGISKKASKPDRSRVSSGNCHG